MAGLAGRLARGVLAGAAGTLAMDLLWWSRARRSGSDAAFLEWELDDSGSFDDAGAPAQVGRRAAALVGVDLPDEVAGTTTNVVHWLTGIGYGLAHALRPGAARHPVRAGLTTGAGAFANSYATLGAMGVYEPIWEYDAETLAKDLSAHLLFGATTGIVHGALARRTA